MSSDLDRGTFFGGGVIVPTGHCFEHYLNYYFFLRGRDCSECYFFFLVRFFWLSPFFGLVCNIDYDVVGNVWEHYEILLFRSADFS